MKLVSYEDAVAVRVGIVEGHEVIDAGTSLFDLQPSSDRRALSDVKLLAPVARPSKIVCVGLNYRDHAEEAGMEIPKSPILFAKFPSTIIGPDAPIRLPNMTEQVDYEAELGVVISKVASEVAEADALDYVLGYTCLNDVSARDLQFADGQWVRGKGLDTFCPIGPWIVTGDEVSDPQNLNIKCVLNGEVLQDSSTSQMIFSIAELISFISQAIRLEPGDIIATGTPPGVGFARKPQVFLKPGDSVSVEIESIGTLTNPVAAR